VNESLEASRLEAERAAEAQRKELQAALQVAREGLEASMVDLTLKTDAKLDEVALKTDALSLNVDSRWGGVRGEACGCRTNGGWDNGGHDVYL